MSSRFAAILTALVAAATACSTHSVRTDPSLLDQLSLAGQYIVDKPAVAEPAGVRFGGLSGLADLDDGRELLAVADDRERPRVFKLRISEGPAGPVVSAAGTIYLEPSASAPSSLDPEAIAARRDGHFFITSEGVTNDEPRLPPAIIEYARDGRFVRQLVVRPRYVPNPTGPMTVGVRDNAAFESLAITADGSRMYTATELPLSQDGDANPFTRGAPSRILEYVRTGASYEPGREFAYEIEPVERPLYDLRFGIAGLVELLALGDDEFLAMERGFVESVDRQQATNRIRLFRISIKGATDISSRDSLRDATDIVPVRKTLVLDVNALPGLVARLSNLDNFEGMAWGPPLPGGRPLILVSDDNFSERQVTAFLFLRPGHRGKSH